MSYSQNQERGFNLPDSILARIQGKLMFSVNLFSFLSPSPPPNQFILQLRRTLSKTLHSPNQLQQGSADTEQSQSPAWPLPDERVPSLLKCRGRRWLHCPLLQSLGMVQTRVPAHPRALCSSVPYGTQGSGRLSVCFTRELSGNLRR